MTHDQSLEVFIAGHYAGSLSMLKGGMLTFTYNESAPGPDLSVQMPFSSSAYSGRRVQAWFDNLLPDDESVRRGMATNAQVGSGIFPLLSHYGLDLPGAVQIVPQDNLGMVIGGSDKYVAITEAQIGRRLRSIVEAESMRRAHAWTYGKERWSLGGNQAKLALRFFENAWYTCEGNAASNVIVKPGVALLNSQALDECVTMRLAKKCGLPVADTRLFTFDGISAIVVKRYDRFVDASTGGVLRIHQEDLCQATSTMSSKKYAADGGPSSADVIGLLQRTGDNSVNRFVDALLFNYLTASTDAHAKNYSLLHPERGKYMLAPLYDIASTAPYMKKGTVYRTAMSIGGENRIGWLRKSSLTKFAHVLEMDADALADRADALAQLVKENLEDAVNDFSSCQGIDELASRLIPRVRSICATTQRNIRIDSAHFKPADVSRLVE